jgi:hypothetical protein
VLVTGGAPTFIPGSGKCNDCESGSTPSLLCSIHQASLFNAPSTLTHIADLQVGRFGHTGTLLRDGAVLLVGGISLPPMGQTPRLVADAEIYNPRTAVPPYDQTQAMPVDADDPLAADLQSLSLLRAPGGFAYVDGKPKTPAQRCGDF